MEFRFEWVKEQSGGATPAARSSHTTTWLGDKLMVFGGISGEEELADAFLLHIDSLEWSQFSFHVAGGQTQQDNPVGSRVGHSTTLLSAGAGREPHLLFVFGGWGGPLDAAGPNYIGNGFLLDTESGEVKKEEACQRHPWPRRDHTATLVDGRLLIFGGWNSELWNYTETFNELWALASDWKWTLLDVTGAAPAARRGHSSSLVGMGSQRKLFVFGGMYGYSKFLDDLHCLDVDECKWESLTVSGSPPSARAYHSATVIGESVIFFGGLTGYNRYTNELFLLHCGLLAWSQVQPPGPVPSPRCSHTATAVGNRVLILGGVGPGVEDTSRGQMVDPIENRHFSSLTDIHILLTGVDWVNSDVDSTALWSSSLLPSHSLIGGSMSSSSSLLLDEDSKLGSSYVSSYSKGSDLSYLRQISEARVHSLSQVSSPSVTETSSDHWSPSLFPSSYKTEPLAASLQEPTVFGSTSSSFISSSSLVPKRASFQSSNSTLSRVASSVTTSSSGSAAGAKDPEAIKEHLRIAGFL
eukprot:GILK01003925.1.p1 GENE.GILK01003925.1~~GILK01003925.1.p1  ORF type:complete len:525 (+),score=89.33 GILK01003925.1:55-1629(+)